MKSDLMLLSFTQYSFVFASVLPRPRTRTSTSSCSRASRRSLALCMAPPRTMMTYFKIKGLSPEGRQCSNGLQGRARTSPKSRATHRYLHRLGDKPVQCSDAAI